MLNKKLVNKCLELGLSFSIVFGGMSGMTVRENGATDTEAVSVAGNAINNNCS
ncbi:MAG: hypothetical protein K2O03_03760 [Lachnospiraceae bacterium]|nr:hypothetical protein [Lachnospiraceae bacterium]